jgi:[acyl-carrier-protein] S-malonyltransferase
MHSFTMLLSLAMLSLSISFKLSLKHRTSSSSFAVKALHLHMSADKVSYKVGFMFPGQGAQAVGMSAALYNDIPAAKALFDKASEMLGYSLIDKCINGPKEELDSTVIAQTAIFVSSMAALEKLKIDDPAAIDSATVSMGLSLGEYSALCFAGAISFEDGVKLTKARGEAMQEAANSASSGMVAIIGLPVADVQKICDEAVSKSGKQLSIANYLVDGNYAVSGAKEACDVAREIAPSYGARMAVPLAVAGAFHTSYMEPAVEKLRKALSEVTVKPPRIPVISNVDAMPHSDPNEIKEILTKQVTQPVQWEKIITAMVTSPDFVKAYEVGPGTVCRGIVKRFGKKLEVVNVPA